MPARKKQMTPPDILRQTSEIATTVEYAGHQIKIRTAVDDTALINVEKEVIDFQGFHGDPHVHHLVSFGQTYENLIGDYNGEFGDWNPDKMLDQDILVVEHYDTKAKKIIDQINLLAMKLAADSKLYQDPFLTEEYFNLAREGYKILDSYQSKYGIPNYAPLSLERGALVATRLKLGVDPNAVIDEEIRVVTKRCHEKVNPTGLSVTVKWRDRDKMKVATHGQSISLYDFVNPAAGSSTVATILAMETLGVKPKHIVHGAICATMQGIMFNKHALEKKGIRTTFCTLGIATTLNEKYYLMPPRAVGDAGDALASHLPNWYQQ